MGKTINVIVLILGVAMIVYWLILGVSVRFGQSIMFLWPLAGGLCIARFFFWRHIYATGNYPPMLPIHIARIALGALLIALYIKNAYNILMFAWSFYAAAAGLPAFAALYWKKATKAGVLSGMAAGFTVTISWKLLGQPFGLGATVPGAIACALALVLVSLATCKKHPSVYLDPRKA